MIPSIEEGGVTIVVNVYNGERFVAECLDSIVALEGAVRPRVIVIDDASTDTSLSIVEAYARYGFSIIRNEHNIGAAASISKAFGLVQTEFVARIDYDDRYKPDFLSTSLAALRAHPDAAFVCAGIQMIDPEGQPRGQSSPLSMIQHAGCETRFNELLFANFVCAPTVLGRLAHWRRAIPVPDGMNFCDWYMNLVMAQAAPIVVLGVVTADYRIHPMNMHATNVLDRSGEAATFRTLSYFLDDTPSQPWKSRFSSRIKATHYFAWADLYFGQHMDADAMRCYREGLHRQPGAIIRNGAWRRCLGLVVGRGAYERVRSAARWLQALSNNVRQSKAANGGETTDPPMAGTSSLSARAPRKTGDD